MTDLDPCKGRIAGGQLLGGLLTGVLYGQDTILRFQHLNRIAPLQPGFRNFPQNGQPFSFRHRQLLRTKQRPGIINGGDFEIQ